MTFTDVTVMGEMEPVSGSLIPGQKARAESEKTETRRLQISSPRWDQVRIMTERVTHWLLQCADEKEGSSHINLFLSVIQLIHGY